ncbi:hypothetical protein [Segatella maculosa]|uniref:Glycoside hydrolase family 42 N-terminal domain-containing protein n=1 Tax=Segatella maculosa OT 289 TaxID=999422 RepID=H1HQS3_9BACT|nr:hypothetical protein [Segatella maculosa]EHO65946.1 hypothetical protein HMPREF9944_02517 [Segatella maculosa OT 289]
MNLKRFTVTSFFLSLTFLGINALTCCQSNGDGPEEKPEIPKPKPQGPMQLTSKVKFPMLAWIGLPPNSSREAYSDMKAAGFDYDLLTYYGSVNQVKEALDKADEVGIKCFINCPELGKDPQKAINALKDHPAVAGWYIIDEPKLAELQTVANKMKKFRTYDTKNLLYVNLLSIDSPKDFIGDTPEKYVNDATSLLPLEFLSFDFYPIYIRKGETQRRINGLWYKSMEIFAAKAKELNIPLWTFVLSSYYWPSEKGQYPEPTYGDMRLQIYCGLAYGAQMLQYYTYTTPKETTFYNAPIKLDGTKSPTYDRLKVLNQEVKKLSGVFVGAQMIDVWHTGSKLPLGTKALVLPQHFTTIKTSEGGAIVSHLKKGDRNFLMIVNHSPTEKMSLEIKGDSYVKEVDKDAYIKSVDWNKPHTYSIEPGDMKLFTWQ